MRATILLLVVSATATLASGCGGSPAEDLCDAACECQGGCPDSARDRCVDQIDRARDAADDAGCGGEMDDYIECVADADGVCEDPQLTGICPSEREEVESCAGGIGASTGEAPAPPPDDRAPTATGPRP